MSWTKEMYTHGLAIGYPICNISLVLAAAAVSFRGKRTRNHQLLGGSVSLLCYAALGALATHGCAHWSGIHYPLSVAALPLLDMYAEGHRPFQLATLLGIYRALSDSGNAGWSNLLGAAIYAYLLFTSLDKDNHEALNGIKRMFLYTQERRLVGIQKIRNIVLGDIELLPKRMQLASMFEEFKYNVDENLFLPRAIFRMAWKPLIPLFLISMFINVLDTMVIVAGSRILYFFDAPSAEHGWSSAYASVAGVFALAMVSEQLSRVKSYTHNEITRVIDAIKLTLFRLPLLSNGLQNNYRINKAHDATKSLASDFEEIISTLSTLTSMISSLALLYVSIGWFSLIPLAIQCTYSLIEHAARKVSGSEYSWGLGVDSKKKGDMMDEIFYNIKSIKMFGWERLYTDSKLQRHWEVAEAKKYEVWYAPIVKAAWICLNVLDLAIYDISAFLSLLAYIHFNPSDVSSLSAANMFQLNSLIVISQSSFYMMYYQIHSFSTLVENIYIIERALKGDYINTLRHPQSSVNDESKAGVIEEKNNSDPVVRVQAGEFSWMQNKPVLKDVSFEANAGDLVAVVGKTGSGKSSLLMSICGEVEMTSGSGTVVGSIALVEQTPWIMNGTLRENILFGRGYDEEFYNKAIFACALSDDIANWKNGDMTVIGERGINISGGQMARLALARAVYSRADIYILDDPLSAVDAHVKRHILDHVVMDTGLLSGKIRIMSTYENKLHPYVNAILDINSDGTVTTTLQQNPAKYQPKSLAESVVSGPIADDPKLESPDQLSLVSEESCDDEDSKSGAKDDGDNEPQELPDSDKRTYGNWDTLSFAFKVCGPPALVLIIISAGVMPLKSFIFDGYKLSALKPNRSAGVSTNQAVVNYMLVNALDQVIFQLIRQLEEYVFGLLSTNYLKSRVKNMFADSLVHAPLSFFDSTTRQAISHSYNDGIETITNEILIFLMGKLSKLISACLILYRVGTNAPQLLVLVPFFVWAKNKMCPDIAPVRTTLKAIEKEASIDESKVEDVIADGQQLIRIFNVEKHFTSKYIDEKDRKQRVQIPLSMLSSYSSTGFSCITGVSHAICEVALITQNQISKTPISSAGFMMFKYLTDNLVDSVTEAVNIHDYLIYLKQKVDTFRGYIDLKREELYVDGAEIPEKDWPAFGKIEFNNFSMKYRHDLEFALKDVNLTINPGEKMGIVGRTGAGKTSLARCLFQLVEKSTCSGSIVIDGHNTLAMNIKDVRTKLGIIPQEPTLFNGTLRQNLDPLVKYTAEDMWSAITKCGIADLMQPSSDSNDNDNDENNSELDEIQKEIERWDQQWSSSGWMMRTFMYLFVRKPTLKGSRLARAQRKTHGLDHYINNTFSNGQKQLVGLCRLLMRNRRIIVLDEATANVDPESDKSMQRLIHSEFKDCTVLTIAHRLETIMNSDRIVVMDHGQVVEVGHPAELLAKKGHFADLVSANDFGE